VRVCFRRQGLGNLLPRAIIDGGDRSIHVGNILSAIGEFSRNLELVAAVCYPLAVAVGAVPAEGMVSCPQFDKNEAVGHPAPKIDDPDLDSFAVL